MSVNWEFPNPGKGCRRTILRAVAGLGAVAMLGGFAAVASAGTATPAAAKTQILKLPDCPKDVDVCLIAMGIHATSDGTITGYVRVKTQHVPKAFEMFARFYTRIRGVWFEQDTKTWKKDKLPELGETGDLVPHLHTFCNTGPWMMSLHGIGISHGGVHQNVWYFYPAVKRPNAQQLHEVLKSSVDLPQRKWPFLIVRHCT